MDAIPLAEQHCSKFDMTAKFSRIEGNRAIFDCVGSRGQLPDRRETMRTIIFVVFFHFYL
jgi:hypothetical protein